MQVADIINLALKEAAPSLTMGNKPKKQSFWSEERQIERAALRAARKKATRNPDSAQHWTNYIASRHLFKCNLEKAKCQSWRTHTEKAQSPRN